MPEQRDADLLDESQRQVVNELVVGGMNEREAELRVLAMPAPREIDKVVRTAFQPYPRIIYNANGAHKIVKNKTQHEQWIKAGWSDAPTEAVEAKFQKGGIVPEGAVA